MVKWFYQKKRKPYWGNHFWSWGYCVSTIGLDENKIKKYVKYQEERERQEVGRPTGFWPLLEASFLKPPAQQVDSLLYLGWKTKKVI